MNYGAVCFCFCLFVCFYLLVCLFLFSVLLYISSLPMSRYHWNVTKISLKTNLICSCWPLRLILFWLMPSIINTNGTWIPDQYNHNSLFRMLLLLSFRQFWKYAIENVVLFNHHDFSLKYYYFVSQCQIGINCIEITPNPTVVILLTQSSLQWQFNILLSGIHVIQLKHRVQFELGTDDYFLLSETSC